MAHEFINLGGNSCILKTAGVNATEVKELIVEWLCQHGWELWDTKNTEQVLRAPYLSNEEEYKYISFSITSYRILIKLYESWNNSSHVGVNGVESDESLSIISGSSNEIYIFATSRYICIKPYSVGAVSNTNTLYLHSSMNGFLGVYEIDCPFNPDGINCIITDTFLMDGVKQTTGSSSSTVYYWKQYIACRWGTVVTTNLKNYLGLTTPLFGKSICSKEEPGKNTFIKPSILNVLPSKPNIFNPNKLDCFEITALYSSNILGKLFGIKLMPATQGSELSLVKIPCDDEYRYTPLNKGGTEKEHVLLSYRLSTATNFLDVGRVALPL